MRALIIETWRYCLESYVLKLIGAMDADREQKMEKLLPLLRHATRKESSWDVIVSEAMELGPDFQSKVESLWRSAKHGMDAHAFAKRVVERNFDPSVVDVN
jgi:hypothetical protein